MIQPDQFKDVQALIIKSTENDSPSTPANLFLGEVSPGTTGPIFLHVLSNKGGEWIRKATEIGTDVARSDLVRQVAAADVVTQAAAGAVVGVGIAIAIPYSIVGLGTGAAIGATLASWRYFTK